MREEDIHRFVMFFGRLPGLWWLTGDSLIHWITHRELRSPVEIAVSCSAGEYRQYQRGRSYIPWASLRFDQPVDEDIVATEEDKRRLNRRKDLGGNGLWQRNISITSPIKVQLPFKYGKILDKIKLGWWMNQNHNVNDIPPGKPVWFTPERKRNGYELIKLMYECAERAEMRDALFISFGTLLGYVKFGDLIPYDNDLDMCVMTDRTTPENIRRFIKEIQKPFQIGKQRFPHGLGEYMFRFSNNRTDHDYPVWLSVGHRSITKDNGVKSCVWMMFKHSNYYFHSKGDRWVTNAKFPGFQLNSGDRALALGQPAWTLDKFVAVNFHGVNVNAPLKAGSCLTWWYDGFSSFEKDASAHKRILAIKDWNKKTTWRMG